MSAPLHTNPTSEYASLNPTCGLAASLPTASVARIVLTFGASCQWAITTAQATFPVAGCAASSACRSQHRTQSGSKHYELVLKPASALETRSTGGIRAYSVHVCQLCAEAPQRRPGKHAKD